MGYEKATGMQAAIVKLYVFRQSLLAGTVVVCACRCSIGAAQPYSLTDLGNLGGPSEAFALNDQGQVVGVSHIPDGAAHAFLWSSKAGMADLGTLSGDTFSGAIAINNAGQVLGVSQSVDPKGTTHVFLWQAGGDLTDIGAGTGWSLQPLGLNAQGQVVGVAGLPNQSSSGFIYTPGTGVALVTVPGAKITDAYAINNQGQMALRSSDFENVLLYTPGHPMMKIEGGPALVGGAALAMNDNGTVVGFIEPINGADPHAYVWNQTGGLVDLGAGFAEGVNNLDQVVGVVNLPDGSPMGFLYDAGTLYALSDLLGTSGTGWTGLFPSAINDNGQIAGYGRLNGQLEGFLLTPNFADPSLPSAPEPATLPLLALAGGWLIARPKRWRPS